ncbi:hypothetical protein QOZ80_2AG0147770 [Eleusine coracana subsp. coracana]|nr:hypothetical protein QOZ80_2AG0147770 [Eleusine coracana subsp. coracana]
MGTTSLVLVAVAFLILSSDTMAKVSARCPDPESIILNPGKPCKPQACRMSCAQKYHDGLGICLNANRCNCEFCLDSSSPSARKRMMK